jgi:hypothetical protein
MRLSGHSQVESKILTIFLFSAIPVFYLSDSTGSMQTDIYLSYAEAKDAASGGLSVKATSLDQVM